MMQQVVLMCIFHIKIILVFIVHSNISWRLTHILAGRLLLFIHMQPVFIGRLYIPHDYVVSSQIFLTVMGIYELTIITSLRPCKRQ